MVSTILGVWNISIECVLFVPCKIVVKSKFVITLKVLLVGRVFYEVVVIYIIYFHYMDRLILGTGQSAHACNSSTWR